MPDAPKLIMVLGYPAAGKTTVAMRDYVGHGFVRLNRDEEGGKVIALLPKVELTIKSKNNVVMDNLFMTAADRKPFIERAVALGAEVHAVVVKTSIEDAQVNALNRMWDRYSQIFFSAADIQSHEKAKKDPNIFPISVLFNYRKKHEVPDISEGFAGISEVKFAREPWEGSNKALILDYDGTLRTSTGPAPYPMSPEEVKAIPGRAEVLQRYLRKGYRLLGVSDQSVIAKGDLTSEQAEICFDRTNELLGVNIEYHYSPAKVPPITTYCRKPQSGIGVMLIRKHNLDPSQCIMVGDRAVDKIFAKRLGFRFVLARRFFSNKGN